MLCGIAVWLIKIQILLNVDNVICEKLATGMHIYPPLHCNFQEHSLHLLDEYLLRAEVAYKLGKDTHVFIFKSFLVYQLHHKVALMESTSHKSKSRGGDSVDISDQTPNYPSSRLISII